MHLQNILVQVTSHDQLCPIYPLQVTRQSLKISFMLYVYIMLVITVLSLPLCLLIINSLLTRSVKYYFPVLQFMQLVRKHWMLIYINLTCPGKKIYLIVPSWKKLREDTNIVWLASGAGKIICTQILNCHIQWQYTTELHRGNDTFKSRMFWKLYTVLY